MNNARKIKYLKYNNAITLISLIITVIILIILAGIVAKLSIGENELFNKAKYAKQVYENTQRDEEENLNELYGQLLVASDGTINNISLEKLKEIIQKEISNGTTNPTGTVISYMGNNAPSGYLFCDGKEYNISDYRNLAEQIKNEFGSYNYYGGDGTNTFAVPDLRGEFLRGTGTATRNTGSGSNVGIHQNATSEILHQSNNSATMPRMAHSSYLKDYDKIISSDLEARVYNVSGVKTEYTGKTYSARPTNTSVLYCIKY